MIHINAMYLATICESRHNKNRARTVKKHPNLTRHFLESKQVFLKKKNYKLSYIFMLTCNLKINLLHPGCLFILLKFLRNNFSSFLLYNNNIHILCLNHTQAWKLWNNRDTWYKFRDTISIFDLHKPTFAGLSFKFSQVLHQRHIKDIFSVGLFKSWLFVLN